MPILVKISETAKHESLINADEITLMSRYSAH